MITAFANAVATLEQNVYRQLMVMVSAFVYARQALCDRGMTCMQCCTDRWKEGGPQEASLKGTKGCSGCTR